MCVARSFKMVLEISNDLSAMQLQASFNPADVPFRSFRGMDQAVREAMLPDTQVKTANLHEELDGVSLCQHPVRDKAYAGKSGLCWKNVH